MSPTIPAHVAKYGWAGEILHWDITRIRRRRRKTSTASMDSVGLQLETLANLNQMDL